MEQHKITPEQARKLTLRSDNGAQPCSKAFVEHLGSVRVNGQYTGYNAPDDNAYASYCTSLVLWVVTLVCIHLSVSLIPCCLTGGFGPG